MSVPRTIAVFVALALWCGLGVFLWAAPHATVLNNPSSGMEYFIPLSGAWALHCGLAMHTQFSSPFGCLYFAPYLLFTNLCGMGEPVLRYTQALLFVLVSLVAFVALHRRFNLFITLAGMAYFSLFATRTFNTGDSPFVTFDALYYDFLPVALGQLALLVALFPRESRTLRTTISDAALVGLLVVWSFFVKSNLVISDLFLIGAGLLLLRQRRGWTFVAALPACIVLFGGLVLLLSHESLRGLYQDLHMAAQARGHTLLAVSGAQYLNGSDTWGLASFFSGAVNRLHATAADYLPGAILVGAGLGCFAVTNAVKASWLPRVAVFLFLFVACELGRCSVNAIGISWPFAWLLVLCLLWWFKPLLAQQGQRFVGLIWKCLATLFTLETAYILFGLVIAASYNFAAPKHFPAQAEGLPFKAGQSLDSTRFAHLYVMRGAADNSGFSFTVRMNDAIALLQNNGWDRKPVQCLDFDNPFPMLLGTRYPEGQPLWTDAGTCFDANHRPAPEQFFAGADAFLCPKQASKATQDLAALYGPYLSAHYAIIGQNACWYLLWRMKT